MTNAVTPSPNGTAATSILAEVERDLALSVTEDVPVPAVKPPRLTKAERQAAKVVADATRKADEATKKLAEHAATQAIVPWKLCAPTNYGYDYNQKREIDQWADDFGQFPTSYRSYSREEWTQAINVLAAVVNDLATTHPEYQRVSGLYVEEHADDLLLIRSKFWCLQIQVPTKSTINGKRFELKPPLGKDSFGQDDKLADAFAELLAVYVVGEHRDTLLNICCQYLRAVRIRVNRTTWGLQHPEHAHLLLPPVTNR